MDGLEWKINEHPTKVDDLGGTPISGNLHISYRTSSAVFFLWVLGTLSHPWGIVQVETGLLNARLMMVVAKPLLVIFHRDFT